MIKGDKMNKSIVVPKYVHDIAKVQIWCAFAEVNLGEATFEHPVKYIRLVAGSTGTPNRQLQ